MSNHSITEEEQRGVEAIQYLQSLIGIDEPDDEALRGWRNISKHEQEYTLRVASFMKAKEEE